MSDRAGPAEWWQARSTPVQDILLALTSFIAYGILLIAGLGTLDGSNDGPTPIRWILLAAMCALQLLRRRRPVTALALATIPVGLDAFWGPSLPIILVLSELVYAATLYSTAGRSRRVVQAVVAICVAAAIVTAVVSADLRLTTLVILIGAAVLLSPLQAALAVRHHRDRADWERERAITQQRIGEMNHSAAILGERTLMARELHDVISGHLSAIALQSEAVLRAERSGGWPADRRRKVLTAIRSQSVQALSAMRSMIDMLQDDSSGRLDDLDELPMTLSGALGTLRSLVEGSGSTLSVSLNPDPLTGIPPLIDLAGYRIVIEALTNAVKHAQGQHITLTVSRSAEQLSMVISNPLPPGPPATSRGTPSGSPSSDAAAAAGNGLANMLRRVTAVGGRFEAGPDSSPPNSWSVSVRFPICPPAADRPSPAIHRVGRQ